MTTPRNRDCSWVVTRFGAYMHYAVPRMLQKAGRLECLYTDLYAGKFQAGLLSCVPEFLRPRAFRRMTGRQTGDLPLERVRHFPLFGLQYYLRRTLAHEWEAQSAAHLWAGREFGRLVLRSGFGGAGAVYSFNTAALEILRGAKERGLFTVMEQTIAARAYEEEVLAEEDRRFPGWNSAPRLRGRYTQETIEREAEEWKHADLITCGSQFVKDSVAHCGGPVERCVVVPYGVDASFAPIERPPHDGPLRVLSVGEAGLRKGVTYAAELGERLKGKAEFRWVGPVSLTAEGRKQAEGRVELTGAIPRSQILPHYEWADVFFLPSVCEGSATVVYEALQTGLPVVTTPNAGSLVEDGVNGFITPIRDLDAMEQRLLDLRGDCALRGRMSLAARASQDKVSLDAYQARLVRALGIA